MYVERVRFFGPGGDWDIRRNRDSFHWRFIGLKQNNFAAGIPYSDFWKEGGIAKLVVHEETLFLWGEWRADGFREDKVSSAKLDYPFSGKRVIIQSDLLTYYGRPQFSWYKSLEGL